MSSGAAVGVAVVAVVGGSMWLAAKGVQAGALVAARSVDMLGAGLMRMGDRAVQARTQWEADHSALVEWENAARVVVDLNARIEVIRQHATADLAAGLPAPLTPCGQSPSDLMKWAALAAAATDRVEAMLRERTSNAVLAVLRQSVDVDRPLSADEAFQRYHKAMSDKKAKRRAVPPEALAAVARIVDRLSPDASGSDRADVLAAAAQVAVSRPDVDHETLLDELRLRVQRAEDRAERRRADAMTAAVMLQAIQGRADDPDLPGLRGELADVVAARRELDDGLRDRAESARQRVHTELENEYIRASVVATLADLGYEADQGFATVNGSPDRMRLLHNDWNGHAVQVAFDGNEMRAAVVRLEDRVGNNARREDVEREEQWCEDFEQLRSVLDGSGVGVVLRSLVAPGERVLPVVKRRDEAEQQRGHAVRAVDDSR